MNQYETVFILTPVLSDVQAKEAVEKFKGILAEQGAEIINEEAWGMKKLAYPIQKKSTGFYQMVEFKAEPTVVDKLEVAFRRDERVMRYLTVKMESMLLNTQLSVVTKIQTKGGLSNGTIRNQIFDSPHSGC